MEHKNGKTEKLQNINILFFSFFVFQLFCFSVLAQAPAGDTTQSLSPAQTSNPAQPSDSQSAQATGSQTQTTAPGQVSATVPAGQGQGTGQMPQGAMPAQSQGTGQYPGGQPGQMQGQGTGQYAGTGMSQASAPTPADTGQTTASVEQSSSAARLSEEEMDKGVQITKDRITLDLKGIDVMELLRILSLKMDKTIVYTKNVSGRVNIFLNNLTFDDVLDVILLSQDLACEKKGEIINIMTSAEYEKLYGRRYNEKREFKTLKLTYAKPQTVFNALGQVKSDIGKVIVDEASGTIFLIDIPEKIKLMEATVKEIDTPPQTEVFNIKYAKTADMKTQLTSAITTGPGELYVDDRSSKVIITDLPQKIRKIKRIVKAFDEETRQVFIEAEIVQITLKNEFQRGVNWQKLFAGHQFDNLNLTGTFPVASSFTPSPLLTADFFKLVVGTLGVDDYATTLTLLETYGDTKILSRPRISVVNNAEAKILVGSREAYITQSQSQAESTTVTSESVEFIDVGVKLNVVPTINADGFITMKIKPEISSVRETLTTSLGSKVPIVETSEAETTVKIKDGQMIMIGGLIKDDKRTDVSGLPFLSRIPFLGTVFGTRSTLKKRTEIIIFLKPRLTSGAEPLAGTEMQRVTPPEMIPKDMKKPVVERAISQKVKGIQIEPEKDEPATIEEVKPLKLTPGKSFKLAPVKSGDELYEDFSPDTTTIETDKISKTKAVSQEPPPATKASTDIENKMKGLKEY